MDIFRILNNIYTNKSCSWIAEIEDSDIQPYLIQRWLCMNGEIRSFVRYLNNYTFGLPPKMYLSLAWSIIPKHPKAPFVKYIKAKERDEKYDFILKKIRSILNASDNDWRYYEPVYLKEIQKDTLKYFSMLGVEKSKYKEFGVDFNLIRKEPEVKQRQPGLSAFM